MGLISHAVVQHERKRVFLLPGIAPENMDVHIAHTVAADRHPGQFLRRQRVAHSPRITAKVGGPVIALVIGLSVVQRVAHRLKAFHRLGSRKRKLREIPLRNGLLQQNSVLPVVFRVKNVIIHRDDAVPVAQGIGRVDRQRRFL